MRLPAVVLTSFAMLACSSAKFSGNPASEDAGAEAAAIDDAGVIVGNEGPPSTGLVMWLDPSGITKSGNDVTGWNSKNADGPSASVASGCKAPIQEVVAGGTAVRFDGVASCFSFTSCDWVNQLGVGGVTIFVAAQPRSDQPANTTGHAFLSFGRPNAQTADLVEIGRDPVSSFFAFQTCDGSGACGSVHAEGYTTAAWHVYEVDQPVSTGTTAAAVLYLDGSPSGTASGTPIVRPTSAPRSECFIGRNARDASFTDVDIGEVLVYARAVTSADRDRVVKYLRARWP